MRFWRIGLAILFLFNPFQTPLFAGNQSIESSDVACGIFTDQALNAEAIVSEQWALLKPRVGPRTKSRLGDARLGRVHQDPRTGSIVISRQAFLAVLGVAVLAWLTSPRWARPVMLAWERRFPPRRDPEVIRRQLLDALERLQYFIPEITQLRLPPELHLNVADLLEGVQNLAQLIRTGEIQITSSPTSGALFVVANDRQYVVNAWTIDAVLTTLNDVLLHESVHVRNAAAAEHQRAAAIGARLIEKIRATHRQKIFDAELDRGRPVSDMELLQGAWIDGDDLKDEAFRRDFKEYVSITTRAELEAYTVQFALLSLRARRQAPPQTFEAYQRSILAALRKRPTLDAMLRRWLRLPQLEEGAINGNIAMAASFRGDRLTAEYLDAMALKLLDPRNPAGFTRAVLLIAHIEVPGLPSTIKRGTPDWDRFLAWVRGWAFRLETVPTAHAAPTAAPRSPERAAA